MFYTYKASEKKRLTNPYDTVVHSMFFLFVIIKVNVQATTASQIIIIINVGINKIKTNINKGMTITDKTIF